MRRFRITYQDPATGEMVTVELEFEDTPAVPGIHGFVSAEQWAEDYAYSAADKGSYTIKEV